MKKTVILLMPLLLSACMLDIRDNLLTASRNLNYYKVKSHVEAGDDLDAKDFYDFMPLMLAAYYGNAPIVKYL